MFQQSSLDAWIKIQDSGRLNANQTIVFDVFKNSDPIPLTNSDVSRILRWSINRITPRVLELRNLGKIVHIGWKVDVYSNIRVMAFGIPATIAFYNHYEKPSPLEV